MLHALMATLRRGGGAGRVTGTSYSRSVDDSVQPCANDETKEPIDRAEEAKGKEEK